MLGVCPSLAQTLSYTEAVTLVNEVPQVKLAALNLELAQKQLSVTASPLKGQLTGGYSQTWGETTAPSLAEPTSLNEGDWQPLSLNASFNMLPYGPGHDATIRATWALRRATARLQDEQANAIIELTRGYQTVVLAKAQVALERARLESAQNLLGQVQTQLSVGAATEANRSQAELSVQQSENALAAAERGLAQALNSLSLTLGRTVTDITPDLPATSAVPAGGDLSARSDVLNAELSVAEAVLQRDSTLRDYLPSAELSTRYSLLPEEGSFSLGASFDTRSFQPSASLSYDPDFANPQALAEQSSSTFTLGLSATIPFDVRLGDALEAGRLAVEQSQLQAARVLELASLDVHTKTLAVQDAEGSVGLAAAALEQAHLLLEVARERLAAGIIPQQELTSAKLEVAQAELGLLGAQNTLRLAHMELAQSLALNPLEVY